MIGPGGVIGGAASRTTRVTTSIVGGGGGGGTEPAPDDVGATIIWQDDFESYDSVSGGSTPLDGPYTVNEVTGSVSLDATGGKGGSQAVRFVIPEILSGGGGGPGLDRSVSGLPSHFFVRWSFKLQNYTHLDGHGFKHFLMHHDAEPDVVRYQFGWSNKTDFQDPNEDDSRFGSRSECSSGDNFGCGLGFFVGDWTSEPGEDSATPAPVESTDALIGSAPWNPIDDGLWHRMVVEIKLGSGTAGWTKLWLDGHLYWDSSANGQNYIGAPTTVEWLFTTGSKRAGMDYVLDDVTVWEK